MSETPCSVEGCPNSAKRAGLCWGHTKRRQLGLPLDVELAEPKGAARDRAGMPRKSLRQQLVDAALEVSDYNSEGDKPGFDRAVHRLEAAKLRQRNQQADREKPRPRGRPPTGRSRWARWRRGKVR